MRVFRKYLLLIITIFFAITASAQKVGNLRFEKDYRGYLDEILSGIGSDLNVRFVFDTNYIHQFKTRESCLLNLCI